MDHVCDAECDVNGVIHAGATHHGSGLPLGFLGLCVIYEQAITTLYLIPSLLTKIIDFIRLEHSKA